MGHLYINFEIHTHVYMIVHVYLCDDTYTNDKICNCRHYGFKKDYLIELDSFVTHTDQLIK